MPEPAQQQLRQVSFPGMCPVEDALKDLAAAGVEERGAIFTRREVVEFILDLLRYTSDKALYKHRILEPSFGEGDFLLIVIERLLKAWNRHDGRHDVFDSLKDSIRAVELHKASFAATRRKVIALLVQEGIAPQTAEQLAEHWLICGDFLLTPLPGGFDHVVGNPPYVRQELIPDALIAEYRARYNTIFDRADLYIPFIERSLSLLGKSGVLGFICADRWMKNRYGRQLRQMVAEHFHLRVYVDMVNTPAFQEDVIAYPAITIIAREKPGKTRIARRPEITKKTLRSLTKQLLATDPPAPDATVKELAGVAMGAEPWILESLDQLALVRRLEREFPLIEEAGCKVGIGVATGADKAFIGLLDELDVEPDRKLPLAMTRDILTGEVQWRGLGIVNPFADEGGLVDLAKYREGAFGEQSRPFVGWLMLLEDAPKSRSPVRDVSPHFPVFPEFEGASYADRYSILCRKLVQEQLYTAASIIRSPRSAADSGEYSELSDMTGLKTFVTELAGHVAAEAARG